MWVYPNVSQDVAPLLSMATPYNAVLTDENSTDYEISEAGSIFSLGSGQWLAQIERLPGLPCRTKKLPTRSGVI